VALLAAYSFDEGGATVVDYSGNGRDFPLGALGVRTVSGHTNGGLTRDTDVGTVLVAQPAFGQTTNRTVMCWIRGTGTTWLVRWEADALGSGSWGLLHIGGNIAVQARTTTGTLLTRPTFPHPGDGQWHHYAATYDGAAVQLYVDGVLRSSTAHVGGLYATADRINIMEPTDTGTTMDDFRIHDEALDATAITTLMNTPVTASAVTVTGTGDAGLGSLTGTASGTRTTFGAAVAPLGALTASASGTRTVTGTATANLGGLTSVATGTRTAIGTAVANLGVLLATAVATRTTFGTALANLGALVATAIVPNPAPTGRIRISGREPSRRVSGREPREEIP
jgi:hypothetical protein